MSSFQKKKKKSQGMLKEKPHSEETKEASEPNSSSVGFGITSYMEFKIIMINMLKNLLEKIYNMQEQMGNVSR